MITKARQKNFKLQYHFNGKVYCANITAFSYLQACMLLSRNAKKQGKFIIIL